MAINADEWQAFYERAREVMGPEWAATLVRVVPSAGADALATKADLAGLEDRLSLRFSRDLATVGGSLRTEMAELRGEVRAEMADLRTEMARLRTEMRTEMGDMRTEMRTEMGDMRTETADLRGELRTGMADLRASLEATIRAQTWRLSGLLVATLGIGITLARLA